MIRTIGGLLILLSFVAGLWTFTQLSAPQLDRRTRGNPWLVIKSYALYQPHRGILWFWKADQQTEARLRTPALISGAVLIGLLICGSTLIKTAPTHDSGVYVSGARWATKDEVRKAGLIG
jgi:hypothetical protein